MSGINGFTWHNPELCQKMNRAISHRNPDGVNLLLRDNLTLGYVYLKTPDNSRNSLLPAYDESEDVWLIYDGEIYNFEEIRKELKKAGYTFTSDKEAEVLLKAYIEWDLKCFHKFNGVWSGVIYDERANKLILVRDQFGTKPLFYRIDGDNLIFSSEIQGILAHPLPRVPNKRAVVKYLHYGSGYLNSKDWVKSGETFFSNVYQVFPGEYITVELDSKKIERHFWYVSHENVSRFEKYEGDPVDNMKQLFLESIRNRVPKCAEVASSLSGGVDSSSIVCAIRHESPNISIRTLSMVYPGKPHDESKYVKIVVDAAKTKAEYISPSADDFADDLFDLVRTQQEPFYGLAIYGQYKIRKHAYNQGIKILMDGAGADTLLAPKQSHKQNNKITFNKIKDCLLRGGFKELTRMAIQYHGKKAEQKQNDAIAEKVLLCKDKLHISEEDRAKIDIINSSYNLRNDRNSTRWCITTRKPFFDKEVQEFGTSLPNEWRIQNGISKYIFRQSMNNLVPEGILKRKDKQGYVLPDYELMSSEKMRKIVQEITHSDSFLSREYWDGIAVQKLFDDLYDGKVQWNNIFWRIINIQVWHQMYLDDYEQ